jgi:hypothetical protein
MEQRRLRLFLSAILFFSAAGAIQATTINTNTISIDMTAVTPTVNCTPSGSTCSSVFSNLGFTDLGGVQTLTFNYTNSNYKPTNSFQEYTQWVDSTSAIVGTLLVSGTGGVNSSSVYSVRFCEPSCSTAGFTAWSTPITVDYTQFQRGFEMDVSGFGTATTRNPGHNASQAFDIYQVKLDQQRSGVPEPATLPLMVMAGGFGAFVFRRNLVKAARRVGSSR